MPHQKQNIAQQIEDTFLSCTICLQPFDQPKALQCLHTFCEKCLDDYCKQQLSRTKESTVFPCPVCRQDITMPPNGVSGFPYNHLIASLKDAVRINTRPDSFHSNRVPSATSERGDRRPVSTRASTRPSTKCSARFGKFGEKDAEYSNISGLAVHPTGDIVVADCGKNAITVVGFNGVSKNSFSCKCCIRDVAVSKSGSLLVTVSQSNGAILHEYTLDGRFIAQYGDTYENENPFGIAVTHRNKAVISGMTKNRILIFNDRRKQTNWFGEAGDTLEHFLFPYYVTVNSRDDVIISDSGNHRVKVNKIDGRLKFSFGSQGSKNGRMFYPMGVCVDYLDNIYVADANNYRVQMFSYKGKYLATPIKNTFTYGIDVKPINIAFSHDQLVVSLRGARFAEIQVFEWDPSIYAESRTSLLGCCGTYNKVSDSGVYHAWS
ncbi:tripartite motif-containing protein 3-like [Ylistrum balloti]|uniref:tripartite motif-containing protein 3-like n=1 Tax=Ylistrum balloti TaxID=509963 RepID=UPI002905803E|nr:tripartite motif-containing protein 3-like [Ylistrum balloti]